MASEAPKVPIPPLTAEEEDSIILTRITNDERPLRRVLKKFHQYATAASQGSPTATASSVEDTREAFVVELATYQLSLKKAAMVCEAESRQVEQYRVERQRIEENHAELRKQIEELKVALEHAQMLRKRKIEYDQVTERVNVLPPREELEQEISALENDMATIRGEHDTQDKTLLAQKAALDAIVTDLVSLRFIGKDKDAASVPNSPGENSAMDLPDVPEGLEQSDSMVTITTERGGSESGNGESSSTYRIAEEGAVEDDIEMGEVEEEPKSKKKARDEELEEGEASDESSELSEPPDD
ncbi:Tho complex subunit 7-domain-containing protein [Coprinopsis sp. MPI-PUGE-AT-0042]|nr:Tho complex subunit 7-domain-containing protein [Coprinopsis sp. MPI-PUGE-AT-0042]